MGWELADNVRGPKGEKGDTGTIASVTAATLPAGSPVRATLQGTADVNLHLEIPRGEQGVRGPAGTLSSASAESVAADAPARVVMTGDESVKHAHFEIPRGLPGVNAVGNDEAFAAAVAAAGTLTNQRVGELVATLADTGSTVRVHVDPDTGNDALFTGKTSSRPKKTVKAALTALGSARGTIVLAQGKTFPMAEPISLDVNKVQIVGTLNVLDFTAIPSGQTAVTIVGSAAQPLFQPWMVMQGVTVLGYGRDGGQTGIRFFTPTATGKPAAAHTMMQNIAVRGFNIGVEVFSNSYCITFINAQVAHCNIDVRVPDGGDNYGERILWIGSTLFNSPVAIDMAWGNAEMFFIGCSIDYVDVVAKINNARLNFTNVHVETDLVGLEALFQFSGNAGGMRMTGGTISSTNTGTKTTPAIIQNNSAFHAGVILRDVDMHNLELPSGVFATGTGYTLIDGEVTRGGATRSFDVLSPTMNLLGDGSFKETTVVDDWHMYSGAATPTTRTLTDTNGNVAFSALQLDTEFDATAARSLMFTKTSSQGQAAGFRLLVPVSGRAKLLHWMMRYYTEGGGGSFAVMPVALLIHDTSGYPKVTKQQNLAGGAIAVPANEGKWGRLRQPGGGIGWPRVPAWASHIAITIFAGGAGTGSKLYIGSAHVTQS